MHSILKFRKILLFVLSFLSIYVILVYKCNYLFYVICISQYIIIFKKWCAIHLDLSLFMFIFDPFRIKRWLRVFSTMLVLYKMYTTKINIDWVLLMDPFVYILIQLFFLCFNVISTRYPLLRIIFTFLFGTLNLFTVWCIYLVELDLIYQKKLYVFNLSKFDSSSLSYQEICHLLYVEEGVGVLHYFIYNVFSSNNLLQVSFYFFLYFFFNFFFVNLFSILYMSYKQTICGLNIYTKWDFLNFFFVCTDLICNSVVLCFFFTYIRAFLLILLCFLFLLLFLWDFSIVWFIFL